MNLLPFDGEIYYHPLFLSESEALQSKRALQNQVQWQPDEVVVFGKKHVMDRQTAWYGNQPFTYTYSKTPRTALPWTPELLVVKQRVEQVCENEFNCCLLNWYPNGKSGMGWHADNESTLVYDAPIASVSLGVTRKFIFKHNTQPKKIDLVLENGSLLLMQGKTQTYWKHSLPKSLKISEDRINLTFRVFNDV